jgi:hypothetical protein
MNQDLDFFIQRIQIRSNAALLAIKRQCYTSMHSMSPCLYSHDAGASFSPLRPSVALATSKKIHVLHVVQNKSIAGETATISYVQLPPEFAIAAHFYVNALVEGEAQQVQRLVNIAAALARHLGSPSSSRIRSRLTKSTSE